MKKLVVAAMASATLLAAAPARADVVEVGVLRCNFVGGTSFIVGSSRDLDCIFVGKSGKVREHYTGSAGRIGIDLGVPTSVQVSWVVFAPIYNIKKGALEGGYVGASAEATLGAGIGANALIGGFQRSMVLNPLSTQTQTGFNIAAGLSGLSLKTAK